MKRLELVTLCTLISTFFLIAGYIESHDDFDTSVGSTLIDLDQGGTANISAEVYPESFYDKDISLRAESVPSYLHVDFEPQVLKHETNCISTVYISADEEAPLGEHLIRLVSEGNDGKEHSCNLTLNIRSPESTPTPTLIQTPSTGVISIYASPEGAAIYLDGIYKSETPAVLGNVEPGSHIITLKLSGYEGWSKTIDVVAGKSSFINLTMKPVSDSVPTVKIEKIWTEYNVQENNLPGMKIHLIFNTHNLKDENCNVCAYFYCTECDMNLQGFNQSYCGPDGNAISQNFFTPSNVDTSFSDFSLFMPYKEIHLEESEPNITHSNQLKFNVVISNKGEKLAVSDWEYFNLTET